MKTEEQKQRGRDAANRYRLKHPDRIAASIKRQKKLGILTRLRRESQRRLKEFLEAQKDKPCADCYGSFPVECMDFDHLDPRKKLGNIGTIARTRSRRVLEAEIKKCEVVCANCHRMRTKKRRTK